LPVDPAAFGALTVIDGAGRDGRMVLGGCADQGFPAWWADDPTSWHRADGPAGGPCISQVVASSFGFFASAAGAAPNLYHSADGTSWEQVDLSARLGHDYPDQLGVVFAIFVSPDDDRVTLLYSRGAEAESRIATLVTTVDGETWQLGPPESADLFASSSIAAVIPGGPGLIAVGSSPGGEFVPCAAVFTSSDGLDWTRVTPHDAKCEDKVMTDVMAYGDGYVAVGGDFFTTGLMTAWTSPDGTQWTQSPSPEEDVDPAVAHLTAEALTIAGGSIWASGVDFDARRDSGEGRPAMWTSPDGTTWTRVDFDEVRGTIPFLVLDDADFRIGVWPPPHSLDTSPVQLFGAD
jgi:hypothetical protein